MTAMAIKKDYDSRKKARARAEKIYPDEILKGQLNKYMMDGNCKSELAIDLLRAFFKARKERGQGPTTVTVNH